MDSKEILFWKIIHNKYIFKYILNCIRVSFIKYERIDLIYQGNRIGYTEIKSLKWIVEKRQFSMLLDKIESSKYIHIDKSSIELLLRNCQNIDILSKLYDNQKYFKQLSMVDLIKASISLSNEQSLKILLKKRMKLNDNGEFILPIYPSTCLLLIQNSNVSMLHHLFTHLSNRNEITTVMDPIKNQLLKIAISNMRYKDDIISFLFDNEYYKLSTSTTLSTLPTISYYELSQLKSIDNKINILEMNQVKVPPDPLFDIKFTNIDKMNEKELIFIISVIFKLYNSENQNNNQLLATYKELKDITCLETRKKQFKLFIIQQINSDQLYLNYVIQYNEIVPNYKEQIIIMYTFSTFRLNGLNYLIDKYIATTTITTTTTNIDKELQITFSIELFKENLNIDEFIQFIKLYFSNDQIKNTFKLSDVHWCLILKTMLLNSKVTIDILDSIIGIKGFPLDCLVLSQMDITPFSKYKWYISKIKTLIQPEQFKLYNQIPPLNQNEVIDFIIENHKFYQLQDKYMTCQFKSIDKINYFKSVIIGYSNELLIDYSKLDYNKSFFKSLSNGDIGSLENDFKFLKITDFQNGCFNHYDDIIEYKPLFNYLNEKGFKLYFKECSTSSYNDQLFTEYINELFNSYSNNQLDIGTSSDNDGLIIDFSQFPKQTYSILIHQTLFKLNLSTIKLICGQYQNIFNHQTDKEEIEIMNMNIPIVISKTTNFKSKFKYQNVLDVISYYLIQYNNSGKSIILTHILNILYKIILSTIDFKFQYIDQLIQLFEINGIQIQQTSYHLFYYLSLKDIRFGKYLIYKRQSFFGKLLSDLNYESIINNDGNINSTSNILNGFTFKEIKDGDFKTLFLKLRSQLNIMVIQQLTQPDFISSNVILKSNEQDYLFLLECSGSSGSGDGNEIIDLFFQLVKDVNSNKLFGDYQFNYEINDIQPYFFDIKNHLIKSLTDKLSILKFLSMGIKEYNIDSFLEQCLNESRLDNIKYLLSKQTTFKINSIAEYQFQQLFKYNHIDIVEYLFNNHKNLVLINLNNSIGQPSSSSSSSSSSSLIGSVNSNNKLSIFDICFQNSQIEICDLLLSHFPSFFNTITTNNIYSAIRNNQISIIIHYILSQPDKIINSITDDNIIDSLSYHNDYKYLNLNKLIKK